MAGKLDRVRVLGQIFWTVGESIALSSLQLVSGQREDLIYRAERRESERERNLDIDPERYRERQKIKEPVLRLNLGSLLKILFFMILYLYTKY